MYTHILIILCTLLSQLPATCSNELKNHIIPLKDVAPGIGLDDLEPLEPILRDTSIIALGEATHGTREFFQMKHRILEFSVRTLGCTLFGIEASYTNCLPINDYVLYGKGNLNEVVAGQGFWVWNTQEVAELVEWMRTYNQTVPDEEKVQFLGFDCQLNEKAGEMICDLIKECDPDYYEKATLLLQPLKTKNAIRESDISKLDQINAGVQEVKDRIISVSQNWKGSQSSYEQVCFLVRLLEQEWDVYYALKKFPAQIKEFLHSNHPELVEYFTKQDDVFDEMCEKYPALSEFLTTLDEDRGNRDRDLFMAENILTLKNRYSPQSPMVIWAHNGHIALNTNGNVAAMGFHLKNKLGLGYYSFGFTTASGTFQAHNMDMEQTDLQVFTLPAQPENSWAHFCKTVENDKFILDFRFAPEHVWFKTPSTLITIGAEFSSNILQEFYMEPQVPNEHFDGLIYLETTTAARPTGTPTQISTQDGHGHE